MRSVQVCNETVRLEGLDVTIYPVPTLAGITVCIDLYLLVKWELGVGDAAPRRAPTIEDDHVDISIVC